MILMKKTFALVLALCLLLCGCGGKNADPSSAPGTTAAPSETELAPISTTAPNTEAPETQPPVTTEAVTAAPIVYTNPLTGEILDAPFTNRIFAVSINNLK